MGCQIQAQTVSQRKLSSGWPVSIARFMARSSAKPASINRMVPTMCSKVAMTNTFIEKRFIA